MSVRNLGEIFLLVTLLVALYFAFLILKPFASVLFIAAVLAILFYPVYQRILKAVKKPSLASIIVCTLVVAIIIIPIANFSIILTKKSIETYGFIEEQLRYGALEQFGIPQRLENLKEKVKSVAPFLRIEQFDLRGYVLSLSNNINAFLVSSTAGLIKGTTAVITDFLLIILAMYYFFKEGPSWLSRIMYLTPLSNKYDRELYKTFRQISVRSIIVTLIIAVIQGVLGGIGFFLIGVPAFFLGILMAFLSLVPLVGPALVWVPASIILLALGNVGQGIFIFFYGLLIVSTSDNIFRTLLLKGKESQLHPLFIFFSIIGGIGVFGFWGIIYGPLILAIAVTLLHIYELEYEKVLEK